MENHFSDLCLLSSEIKKLPDGELLDIYGQAKGIFDVFSNCRAGFLTDLNDNSYSEEKLNSIDYGLMLILGNYETITDEMYKRFNLKTSTLFTENRELEKENQFLKAQLNLSDVELTFKPKQETQTV